MALLPDCGWDVTHLLRAPAALLSHPMMVCAFSMASSFSSQD